MRRQFPRVSILTALLLTALTALTDSTDFDSEACMAPFADAKAAATERYTKALYAGDFGRADHAEETMTILRELREAELAFDGAFLDCKQRLVQHLEGLILPTLEAMINPPPVQCMVDGVLVDCAEAAEFMARPPSISN